MKLLQCGPIALSLAEAALSLQGMLPNHIGRYVNTKVESDMLN